LPRQQLHSRVLGCSLRKTRGGDGKHDGQPSGAAHVPDECHKQYSTDKSKPEAYRFR
jgi:hypothetical protein